MRLLLRRSALAVPLLLLVSALVFLLLQAVPGGPLAAYLENPNVRPEDIARLRAAMGLDAPVTVQYARWLTAFVQGDWGYSYADGRPVLQRVLERVPATLELVLAGSALALLLALPLGLIAATRVWGARVSRLVTTMGVSVPVFWLGLLLQLLLAMQLGWLPSSGRQSFGSTSVADRLMHLVLPALVLAAVQGAAWTRYLQRAMRDTLALPFVNAGRVRGLSESRLVWRHALPNALGPFVTVVLLDAAMLASGAVVTESVFAWPGVGSLFTEALVKRDYPVLMAFLMVGAVTVIVLNLLADLAVARLDPRTREAT
ncbi:ABC transporter permease [Gemmatimonas sp.]|jgi:peptide/nickel transport system permease protein|uniref:ABC transporter permease n=1 Tax=Gemmatimonas sp. TaxID=1962908 RepID=UPI0037C005B5